MRYTPILTDGKFGDTEELETSDLNIELTNLKQGTRYKVEVVAVNQGGESDPAVRNYQVPAVGGWCSSLSFSFCSVHFWIAFDFVSTLGYAYV